MSELSIFVDESGDFGKVENNSPYYLVSLVFHNQSNDIYQPIAALEKEASDKFTLTSQLSKMLKHT